MRYRVSFEADARSPKEALVIVVGMFRKPPKTKAIFDWLIEDESGQRYTCKASIQHICEGKLRNIRTLPVENTATTRLRGK